MKLLRFQSWLAGIWAGVIIAVGAVAAPTLFATLERQVAGQGAGRIFGVEARLSLAFAVILFVIERRRVRDLLADTVYNTYTRSGLPPTPIAMPGVAALRAALNPPATDYLYFVARGDGSSEFSRTLDEHNRAVAQYIRKRNP